ncbi:hypothetical protein DFJ74DRAFT_742097 [Hyaloraphidium curvatum]|nr:hypothetical protein DFJ74DRAFT_742097 [Hyaloraphidium curvatum]
MRGWVVAAGGLLASAAVLVGTARVEIRGFLVASVALEGVVGRARGSDRVAAGGPGRLAGRQLASLPPGDPATPRAVFPASDTRLRFFGRWDVRGGEASTGWSRGRLRFRATGTSSAALHCRSAAFAEDGTWIERPPFSVVRVSTARDGGEGSWTTLPVSCAPSGSAPGAHASLLLTSLDPSRIHDIEIILLFEGGFLFPDQRLLVVEAISLDPAADLLPPTDLPVIEFVGYSITAPVGFPRFGESSPHLASYAAEAARILGAQASAIAQAGLGLLAPQPPMRDAYFHRGLYPGAPCHDFAAQGYRPRLVAVNLGTNDRWRAVPAAAFAEGYRGLLRQMMLAHGGGNATSYAVVVPFGRWSNGSGTVSPIFAPETWRAIAEGWPRRPRVVLVDTAGWLTPGNATGLMRDAVHPTADGQLYFGAKLGEALRSLRALDDWDPPDAADDFAAHGADGRKGNQPAADLADNKQETGRNGQPEGTDEFQAVAWLAPLG